MRFDICFVLALVISEASIQGQTPAPNMTRCEVTQPNGQGTFTEQPSPVVHGSGALSVILDWPEGTVVFKPGGPGFVLNDGALSMKFPWSRGVKGQLTIDGRRLDLPAPPLRAEIPNGYGDIEFQSTAIIFPTPGCWEVTGHVGEARLTFVTRVVKIS